MAGLELTGPEPALVDRFRRDLAPLLDDGPSLLVAVSGGGDSLALLLLAHAALGVRCSAATVDHGLRPDSVAEAEFVGRFCADRGIDHATLAGELPARSQHTANLSQRARSMRYRLLIAHAARIGAVIATAHHADDQLETVVMRLNRGSGVGGLSGTRRSLKGRFIRPLLRWRRAELAQVVADAGIVPVADPTNVDDRYDRARLRKQLASVDWLDPIAASLSAEALADADEAIDWFVNSDMRLHADLSDPQSAQYWCKETLPVEVARRVVIRCLTHVQPNISLRGAGVMRAVAALFRGESVMLGDVCCASNQQVRDGATWLHWTFDRAPPRRSR